MAINNKLSQPGLIPVKVENQGSLITTQVNKINFTGSGVTASIGEFNDLTILITGGGGSNISASYALSASFASTASYFSGSISNAISASYALTASYFSGSISDAISSSYALTASHADKAELIEILTTANNTDYRLIFASNSGLQNPYLDTETSALIYNPFTNTLAGIDQLNATSITGSLYGTASWAISSSQAITASYVLNAISASYALSSSFASTASYVNPLSQSVLITGSLGVTGSTILYKSGSTVLDIQGSSGQLFSVTDSLTGSLFSVNTVAGLPIIEAFSDNTVNIGKFGVYPIKVYATGTLAQITGSLLGTASYSNQSNSSSFSSNSLLLNNTASSVFAITGSNIFKGDQTISGSFKSTGSFEVRSDSVDLSGTTNILLNTSTIIAPLLPTAIPPGGANLNTVLIDTNNGTLYVTSSLPGSGGGGGGLADRILTGSITASVADGLNPSNPNFFLLQSGSNEMLKFNTDRVMVLESRTDTPTAVTGGIFFSASGDFFFGI
jgi:hypothetical protein